MRRVDQYQQVASIAKHASNASAYTVAKAVVKLERIAKTTRRLGDAFANGYIYDEQRIEDEQLYDRALANAKAIVGCIGLTVKPSDDGMGYLEVYANGRTIAVFG